VFFGFLLRIALLLRIHCVSKTWDGILNFAFAVWESEWADLELLLLLGERVALSVYVVRRSIALLRLRLTSTLAGSAQTFMFAQGQVWKAFIHHVMVGFYPDATVLFEFFRHDLRQEIDFVELTRNALLALTAVVRWNQFWVVVRLARYVGLVLAARVDRRFSLRSLPALDRLVDRVLLRYGFQRFNWQVAASLIVAEWIVLVVWAVLHELFKFSVFVFELHDLLHDQVEIWINWIGWLLTALLLKNGAEHKFIGICAIAPDFGGLLVCVVHLVVNFNNARLLHDVLYLSTRLGDLFTAPQMNAVVISMLGWIAIRVRQLGPCCLSLHPDVFQRRLLIYFAVFLVRWVLKNLLDFSLGHLLLGEFILARRQFVVEVFRFSKVN